MFQTPNPVALTVNQISQLLCQPKAAEKYRILAIKNININDLNQ